MAQLFPPSANALARGSIYGAVFIIAAITWAGNEWIRSSYVTQVDVVRDQPVPFSHDHHVSGLGLDCRYCHASVETSAFAGMPATETCMGCHSMIWKDSPLLAPVRESWRTRRPLAWTRVYDVPDFVYFNHSIHVAKGIGCESCHGRVDQMPLMRKVVSLHMEWCLDCHRHPDRAVREPDKIFAFGGKNRGPATRDHKERSAAPSPEAPRAAFEDAGGVELVASYGIAKAQLTDCVICHR
jgi:hypothetical protein